ncbi:hypothetical protein [Mesorhizobium sp.]|uniref:hypothetical protein n=1 Tax=Mesorhizobium sp. TaxID=1871066 RepID=UPI000FEA7034|nr:hypothetical protein [Mesorhizobium sp.]RWD43904.1 MAG: hypothetical protein EOS35_18670 [Mesorhizobium sp.]TIU10110.1 MAG: hypothetical protein E5W39_01325 [Mesorhizobium sp.]
MVDVVKHPQRYPKHEGDKGQLFGGECNTTRCHDLGARYFNNQTYGFYCQGCARGINRFGPHHPIFNEAAGPLTVDEMTKIHRDYMREDFLARETDFSPI